MASLYFYYGSLGSSKTANALMVAHNYERVGQKALLVKPKIDTRNGENIIWSRIGISHTCISLEDFINMPNSSIREYNCIIVDEAQFATKAQIMFLSDIVDNLDIPVMCYGLRTNFKGELFEGSMTLMAIADVIEEIKTVCWCGKKATFNAKYNETGIVKTGSVIDLGCEDKYVALCRKHYKEGKIKP